MQFTNRRARGLAREGELSQDWGWDAEHRVLTYGLRGLEPGTRYVLPFGSDRFADLSGNPLVPFDFVFTTEE